MKKMIIAAVAFAGVFSLAAIDFKIELEKMPVAENVKVDAISSASQQKYLHFTKTTATSATKIDIPEDGRYYVWVRDFSYGQKVRTGMFYINGRKVGKFGDTPSEHKKGGWVWTRAPFPFPLKAGEAELKIVGRQFSRFDMVLLTTDKEFKPEGKMEDIPEIEPLN